jgi:predicted transcriptional regulator
MTNKGKIIEAIYVACLTKRATLVMFYLINRANQELTCFPSVGTIAKECNMSTRTVQRALNDLEEAGFLERESRFHEKGGQRSNLYHLCDSMKIERTSNSVDFEFFSKNKEEIIIDKAAEKTNDNLKIRKAAMEKVIELFAKYIVLPIKKANLFLISLLSMRG